MIVSDEHLSGCFCGFKKTSDWWYWWFDRPAHRSSFLIISASTHETWSIYFGFPVSDWHKLDNYPCFLLFSNKNLPERWLMQRDCFSLITAKYYWQKLTTKILSTTQSICIKIFLLSLSFHSKQIQIYQLTLENPNLVLIHLLKVAKYSKYL